MDCSEFFLDCPGILWTNPFFWNDLGLLWTAPGFIWTAPRFHRTAPQFLWTATIFFPGMFMDFTDIYIDCHGIHINCYRIFLDYPVVFISLPGYKCTSQYLYGLPRYFLDWPWIYMDPRDFYGILRWLICTTKGFKWNAPELKWIAPWFIKAAPGLI